MTLVQVQDHLWHTAMAIRDGKQLSESDADAILGTWAFCHDLLAHIKRVYVVPNTE